MKLSELKTGLQVTCKIEGEEIESALLYVKRFEASTYIYICQNLKGSVLFPIRLGYTKVWPMCFDNDKPFKPEKWHVTDFKVVE
jgi:Holliday junction resolvase